nr:MAG TPA: hypothetical protein [Caudoviricetes sp.]
MDKRPGYAGEIKNAASQKVKAPFSTQGKKGKTVKKTGEDLRSK